jgi:hypothetical protein
MQAHRQWEGIMKYSAEMGPDFVINILRCFIKAG